MYTPQYFRHWRRSLATTTTPEDDDKKEFGGEEEREDSDKTDSFLKSSEIYSKNTRQRKDEQSLRLAGLRRNSLLLLFIWLGLNISLVLVLQMSPQGMRSLRIYSYINPKTGYSEPAVHFSAEQTHLGQVVANSGKVLGQRGVNVVYYTYPVNIPSIPNTSIPNLEILGSRVLIQTGNETKTVLQGGECRVEGVKQFQIRQPGTDKVLFSARHPLVSIDRRIKKISSGHIITNKLRSPIDESIHITAEDLGLRGNERIQMEAKAINFTAKTGIRFSTTEDGSIRLTSKQIFLGSKWLSLPLSPSPALIASVEAFRVCLCRSSAVMIERPKVFIVPGNRPCIAYANICQ
uniref:Beta-sarcoglycan n=1 Tax=Meloidogyne javanica TaxID=6303 RepID=A0A915MG94_MELJA